ncbi:MAG: helix-turn-helix transcriptional regulator [Clostridiales bacterium]|nr:helix-turn-helix transcriptional regulator [Clostridiales bacterium]
MSNFQKNLKILAEKYTQKYIADKTGFSQSSINNYLSKMSEPSIQFLVALKNSFGICIDDFLFSDINPSEEVSYDRFVGNYIVYYYNNNAYKGEVHSNFNSTLKYGVMSVLSEMSNGERTVVYGAFVKEKIEAVKMLGNLNKMSDEEIVEFYNQQELPYKGALTVAEQNLFIDLYNKEIGDRCFMIFNNPPSKVAYIGGGGTLNTVARGREHNPCVEFVIISRKLIDMPDGGIYQCLKFNDYSVNLDYAIKDLIDLFKRLFVDKNEISSALSDNQKIALVQNKLEYHFNEILEANAFRFAKVSNREDDVIYKLIKEGIDVG